MNKLICAFGGRKYFYCCLWCGIATILVWNEKIHGAEWLVLLMWFFSNVVIANNREAVAEIKSKGAANEGN